MSNTFASHLSSPVTLCSAVTVGISCAALLVHDLKMCFCIKTWVTPSGFFRWFLQNSSLSFVWSFVLFWFWNREMNRNFFNAQFGSLFRTDENPTYFLRRLSRFADIYMASLSCLLNYELDYTFYPRRTPLQHELPGWSDQLCTGTFRIPFLQETVQIK